LPNSKNSLNDLLYEIRRIAESREKLTEKKIQAIYRTLAKDLDGFIADGYKKYADEEGRFYLSYLDAKNSRAKFLQEIVNNVDGISPQLTKEIQGLIDETYEKSYEGMVKAFKKADTAKKFEAIVKDIKVNPNVLKQAVNNNISKLTLPAVLEKHRQEIIYQIQQELNIGLMQGDRYEKMAKRISERVNVSYSKAMNITRTETHRNVESGFMDCAEHLQEGLDGSSLIYAATWRTMDDERVRPQYRYKTKKGWKSGINKNGADHTKMEGVTVKAGEMFNLGNGVKAKAPSKSGVAAHDCNCRCFVEYNLMTPEEFAQATGKKVVKAEKPQPKQIEKPVIQLSDYPEAFTKGAEGKNTQKLIDYINGCEGADPNALKLYSSIGKLENLDANGVTFKISHGSSHAVTTWSNRYTGDITDVKLTIPKLKGDNLAGQVNTTLHEEMHLMDLYGRDSKGKWFSLGNKRLVETVKNTTDEIGEEISDLFKKHNAEYETVRKTAQKRYDDLSREAKEKYLPNGMSPWENMSGYKQYEKERKKLYKNMVEEIDYEARNIMGGGIGNLQDIYDAFSGGTYRANGTVIYGHGQRYYAYESHKVKEIVANYASLSVTRPDLIEMLRKDKPELCTALDELIIELIKKAGV
jgi:uncharacterized protein with gpF-like domain